MRGEGLSGFTGLGFMAEGRVFKGPEDEPVRVALH